MPFAVIWLAGRALSWRAGELTSTSELARRQRDQAAVLVLPAYREINPHFKLVATGQRRARIVALGSSRVMQFRAEYFAPGRDLFYNAGGGANRLSDLPLFLNALPPHAKPEILLVGLDHFWFNPAWRRRSAGERLRPDQDSPLVFQVGSRLLGDLLKGRVCIADILTDKDPFSQAQAIGLLARARGDGFRNDGSFQYASILRAPAAAPDNGFVDTLRRVREGNARFEFGDRVAEEARDEVRSLIEWCEAHGVTLVGFLPPFAPTVAAKLREQGRHTYMDGILPVLMPLFARAGFVIRDYTDMSDTGARDENFIDGFHGSERVYASILLDLARHEPRLAACVDIAGLQDALARSRFEREVLPRFAATAANP